jgi:hypothetical protein
MECKADDCYVQMRQLGGTQAGQVTGISRSIEEVSYKAVVANIACLKKVLCYLH